MNHYHIQKSVLASSMGCISKQSEILPFFSNVPCVIHPSNERPTNQPTSQPFSPPSRGVVCDLGNQARISWPFCQRGAMGSELDSVARMWPSLFRVLDEGCSAKGALQRRMIVARKRRTGDGLDPRRYQIRLEFLVGFMRRNFSCAIPFCLNSVLISKHKVPSLKIVIHLNTSKAFTFIVIFCCVYLAS